MAVRDCRAGLLSSSLLLSHFASAEKIRRMTRVEVDFRGQRYSFRITRGLTFSQLLEEIGRHWNLEIEDFELRDMEECIWPGSGM